MGIKNIPVKITKAGNTKRNIAFLSRKTFSKTTSCYGSAQENKRRYDGGSNS
jgi:hypothetical protein